MKIPDFGQIFLSYIKKAALDFKANRPLAPSAPMTSEQVQAAGRAVQARIAALDAFVTAHPGVITSIDDILDYFEGQGDDWAAEVEMGVNAAPGVLAGAESWLPTILNLYGAFQPAPIGIPGGFSGARGHIGR